MTLPIVHLDPRLIVLNKPTGLLAVPGLGAENQDNLASRVQAIYPEALIVHRLDRDTSGLIVMARDAESQRHLSRQFQDRLAEKTYLAVVFGRLVADAGCMDWPMRKDFDRPPRHRVDPVLGRPATTFWRVLSRGSDRTRLELTPRTGRSHQLRVHLEQLGHPILGDNLYAHDKALDLAERLLLHSSRLALEHPSTGQKLSWTCDCPF
jgi:tRNA pseudouridine32 synthase / 23S rRNA pseudouridine746 synthase